MTNSPESTPEQKKTILTMMKWESVVMPLFLLALTYWVVELELILCVGIAVAAAGINIAGYHFLKKKWGQ